VPLYRSCKGLIALGKINLMFEGVPFFKVQKSKGTKGFKKVWGLNFFKTLC
jgi:hypothetical protein